MLKDPVTRRRMLQILGAGVAARVLQTSIGRAESIPFVRPEVLVSREQEKAFGTWFNEATRAFTTADWVLLHLAVNVEPFILVQPWRSYADTVDLVSCTCVYVYDSTTGYWTIKWDKSCPFHGELVGGGKEPNAGVPITQADEKRFRAWMAATNSLATPDRLLLHLVPDHTRYEREQFATFGDVTYTRTSGQGSGAPGSTSACTCFYDDDGALLYRDRDCPFAEHPI